MVVPSVDNFLKILRFYQKNDTKSIKKLNSQNFKFTSVEKFYEALDYNYDQGENGLNYPDDKKAIEYALNARKDLINYFNEAGFPGSYSFNTADAFMMKSMVLDWASTIKTFQDSTERITNAYSLSSEEVDKAIRGFGINFINARTVPSLNRRQTFLLNMCRLYKIKGSPDSIIDALNIIGIDNIYIQEGWIYPTFDGKKNIEIKWIPVEHQQEFDRETGMWNDPKEGLEVDYWSWDKFRQTLDDIGDCHWFYKKQDIIDFHWGDDVCMKLPSITPYFNIKIKFKSSDQILQLNKIYQKITEQFDQYLHGIQLTPDCILSGYKGKTLPFLDIWLAYLYIIVSYSDFLRYNSLRKFLERYKIFNIDYDSIVGQNKYIQLIYKLYTCINTDKNEVNQQLYKSIMSLYVPTAVPLPKNSYNEVLNWWISGKHDKDDDRNGLTDIYDVIYPSQIKLIESDSDYVEIFWNEKYHYGYYDIQIKIGGVWTTIEENCPVRSESMQRIIPLYKENSYMFEDTLNSDEKLKQLKEYLQDNTKESRIRIVHYRTENNLPSIFLQSPFLFVNYTTETDMLYKFTENVIHDVLFKNELFYKQYNEINYNLIGKISYSELYSNYLNNFNSIKTRKTDLDLQPKSYFNSLLQYPKSILSEDKETLFNETFFEHVIKPTYNYIDYTTHDGCNLNYLNPGKDAPFNRKWNWAISYANNDLDHTYLFINYESCKWCRIKGGKLDQASNISIKDCIYDDLTGLPVYLDGKIYYKVSNTNNSDKGCYFVIDSDNSFMESNWNALSYKHKKYKKTDSLLKFAKECDLHIFNDESDTIEILSTPSDLYPSSVLSKHTYRDKNLNIIGNFYFSDCVFKPNSKLAKDVVVAKIDLNFVDIIYDNVADCFDNRYGIDQNSENDIKTNVIVNIVMDPFGKSYTQSQTYYQFLKFLYINGYTLDINTGYIYKRFDYYLDNNNYLYIKCIDAKKQSDDVINFKWVRVKVSRQWDINENRKSIYYRLDSNGEYVREVDGSLVSNELGLKYTTQLTFSNVYDSERYLADYAARKDGERIPSNVNKFIKIGSGKYNFYVRVDSAIKSDRIISKFINEKNLQKYYNGQPYIYTTNKFKTNLLDVVNYGINQDLLDWINAFILKTQNTTELYEELILMFSDTINNYSDKKWNLKSNLDFYSAHIFKNSIIKDIINFYKPKRDRMLLLRSQMESDEIENVMTNGTGDGETNHLYYNSTIDSEARKNSIYDIRENDLSNRSVIKQVINDYIPFDDLIYLNPDTIQYEVNSAREVNPYSDIYTSKIECYDRLDLLSNYPAYVDRETVSPAFYCSDFDDSINGFYYSYRGLFFLGDYVFMKKEFLIKTKILNYSFINKDLSKVASQFIKIKGWCVTTVSSQNSNKISDVLYISLPEYNENVPYLTPDGKHLKYLKVNYTSDDNFMKSYWTALKYNLFDKGLFQYEIGEYSEDFEYVSGDECKYNGKYWTCISKVTKGEFNENKWKLSDEQPLYGNVVKINLHYTEPLFYMDSFESPEYNGLYYNDGKEKYGKPLYYNQNGKQISYFDLSYLPERYLASNISEFCLSNEKPKGFWIITNQIEIPDLSDAEYIAFDDGSDTIFDSKSRNNITKQFYPIKMNREDVHFLNGYSGYGIDENTDKKILTCNRKFDYTGIWDDLIGRRVSQNALFDKYEPVSYINFYFGYDLFNYGKNLDGSYKTIIKFYRNNKIIQADLRKENYSDDKNGYQYGSYRIKSPNIVRFEYNLIDPIEENSVQNNYHTAIIRYRDLNTNDWKFDCIKINGNHSTTFELTDVDICEYAVYDSHTPDWYINYIVSEYGIFRNRHEVKIQYTDEDSKSYSPAFNTQFPRKLFGKGSINIPLPIEGSEGDRISSCNINGNKTYTVDSIVKTYKWNPYNDLYRDKGFEYTSFWYELTKNRVKDKTIILQKDSNGEYTIITDQPNENTKSFNLVRYPKIDVDGREKFYRSTNVMYYHDGLEIKLPSNYIIPHAETAFYQLYNNEDDKKNIPVWWTLNPSDYKTGDVGVGSPFVAVKTKIDDFYPNDKQKFANYFDCPGRFDGTSGINLYAKTTYDVNTEYGYQSSINSDLTFNIGSKPICPYPDLDNFSIFYDPSIQVLTENQKNNLIYHEEIYLTCNNPYYSIFKLSGKYYAQDKRIHKSDKYDLDCYYSRDIYDGIDISKYIELSEKKNIQFYHFDNDLVSEHNYIVPRYHIPTDHYLWTIRHEKVFLVTKSDLNNKIQLIQQSGGTIIHQQESNIFDVELKDDYKYDGLILDDLVIKHGESYQDEIYTKLYDDYPWVKDLNNKRYYILLARWNVANTYVKSRYVKDKNIEYYDHLNQYQLDICGQKLCEYTDLPEEKLSQNWYRYLKQNIINDTYITSYKTIRLLPESENSLIPKSIFTHKNCKYYLSPNNKLNVLIDGQIYGPFQVEEDIPKPYQNMLEIKTIDDICSFIKWYSEWNNFDYDNSDITIDYMFEICNRIFQLEGLENSIDFDSLFNNCNTIYLESIRTYSKLSDAKFMDCIYTGDKLYIKTQNSDWISVKFLHEKILDNNMRIYDPYIQGDCVHINVAYTNPEWSNWYYHPDIKKFRETLFRYKDLFNLGSTQLDDIHKDCNTSDLIINNDQDAKNLIKKWSKPLEAPKDDEYYVGIDNKESITDSDTAINVIRVCKLDINNIGFFTKDKLWFDKIDAWYNPSRNPDGLYTWDGENYFGKYQNSIGEVKYFKLDRKFNMSDTGDMYDINKTINRFGEIWYLMDYNYFYRCNSTR